MPTVDSKDRQIETAKTRLLEAGQAYGRAYAAMSAARAELHGAIREASALGLSRRDVAARAGVTPGLVQQLVDRTTGDAAKVSARATAQALKANTRAAQRFARSEKARKARTQSARGKPNAKS